MAVVRFGDVSGATNFPSESEFRKNIGRSGLKTRFTRSNKFLDGIYVDLRRAHANPNDRMAMRRLGAACAKWLNKKAFGEYDSDQPSRWPIQIVALAVAASMSANLYVREVDFHLHGKVFHHCIVQRFLIAFQCQNVICSGGDDLLGDELLTPRRVDCHPPSLPVQCCREAEESSVLFDFSSVAN